ncbi:sugar translocase [Xanthomonas sp. BRIP62415]|uniref:sugar translocase n=1 Tax=Xanthomonas sp. BRIP62415 TaxID=2182390 RepID=UPI000F8EC3A8|nr:sugar translocase [Xanthomonas sp. BRIP62415]
MSTLLPPTTPARPLLKAEWLPLLLGAVLSVVAGSVLLVGWRAGLLPVLDYPLSYSGDALSSLWLTQRAMEGWIFENARSGFPFGSSFLDYPGADSGSFLFLKLAGMLAGSSAAALNLFFLLGFAANFLTAYWVMRWLRIGRSLSFTTAMLFTLAPFHFLRLGHIFYTWYFSIPIYFMLAIRIARADASLDFWSARPTRKIALAVLYLVLSCFGVYYTAFGLILIGTSCLIALFQKNWTSITRIAAPAIFFLAAGTLANVAPNVINERINGHNPEVAARAPGESEIYGVKLMHLILPRPEHRLPKLANVTAKYMANTPLNNENTTASMGLIGSFGLAILALVAFARLAEQRTEERIALFATLSAVLLAFMTIGGLGSLFAHVVSPSIRGWNRASIFITFSTLAAVAIVLQLLSDKLGRRHGITIAPVAAVVILVFGAWDQTSPVCSGCQSDARTAYEQDKRFIQSIEAALPPGAAVYQLPYMPFPEVPPRNALHTYDLAVGFLHSQHLKWSYAGMKGREGDLFYRNLETQPAATQLQALHRFGFDAVYIDKRGYADQGAEVIGEWTRAIGEPPAMVREDGDVVVFRLPGGAKPSNAAAAKEALIAEPPADTKIAAASLRSFLTEGWSSDEAWGVWSAGATSSLRYRVNAATAGRTTVILRGNPFLPGPQQALRVLATVNGIQALDTRITAAQPLPLALRIPVTTRQPGEVVRIVLNYETPVSPAKIGLSMDQRLLAFGLTSLEVCTSECDRR